MPDIPVLPPAQAEKPESPDSSLRQAKIDAGQPPSYRTMVREQSERMDAMSPEEREAVMLETGFRRHPESSEWLDPADVKVNHPELVERAEFQPIGNLLLKSINSLMWRQGY